jgi:hypothetical protein|tara:strand:- start:371 stop:685 length:315 start_codon:yes stop_codon:yes gene_type:complete
MTSTKVTFKKVAKADEWGQVEYIVSCKGFELGTVEKVAERIDGQQWVGGYRNHWTRAEAAQSLITKINMSWGFDTYEGRMRSETRHGIDLGPLTTIDQLLPTAR